MARPGGGGSAVLAAAFPADLGPNATLFHIGIGLVAVSLAFGLTVLTMACAIGHVSGCHLNPAVSVGLFVAKKMDKKDLMPYIVAQVLGGIAGAGILLAIASGQEGFSAAESGFASNGFGEHSPGGFSLGALIHGFLNSEEES